MNNLPLSRNSPLTLKHAAHASSHIGIARPNSPSEACAARALHVERQRRNTAKRKRQQRLRLALASQHARPPALGTTSSPPFNQMSWPPEPEGDTSACVSVFVREGNPKTFVPLLRCDIALFKSHLRFVSRTVRICTGPILASGWSHMLWMQMILALMFNAVVAARVHCVVAGASVAVGVQYPFLLKSVWSNSSPINRFSSRLSSNVWNARHTAAAVVKKTAIMKVGLRC